MSNTPTTDAIMSLETSLQIEAALAPIKAALKEYHHALDTRQHGGVAACKLADALEEILHTPWIQGATLKA